MSNKFTFFWSGPFSNWFPSFFMHGGITYDCGEQYMMYQKALLFNDAKMAEAILESSNPKEQKALGRKVKGFDAEKWSSVCVDIMVDGLFEKFTQDPYLKQCLIDTGDTEIVEASPYDQIWGIGLSENDPRAQNKEQWRGQNLLGITLMKVRDRINEKLSQS